MTQSGDRFRESDDCLTAAIRQKHLRVLVIDDEDNFRKAMSFYLTRKFAALVKQVSSGNDAVEALKAGATYDIIFLDLMMPGMNGIETYRQLKNLRETCPIILMSAYSDTREWDQARELEVEMIPKPIPGRVIAKILAHLVE